jgi:hypothetical protein
MTAKTGASLLVAGAIGLCSLGVAGIGSAVVVRHAHSKTIHGCVARSDGALRVVKSARSCTAREKPLSFNKQGRRGPAGKSPTFQMFANVDGEGDLGSNHDAVGVTNGSPGEYTVKFSKPIGHCAAVAQSGKAGGPDKPASVVSTVQPAITDPSHTVLIDFVDLAGHAANTPFMVTVTC